MSPQPQVSINAVCTIDRNSNAQSLTFDDGRRHPTTFLLLVMKP